MSREALINDLRAKGTQQVETLWREAREELERFRAEAAALVVAERNSCDLTGREATRALQRQRTMIARRRAGEIITRAERQLSERLYILARNLLGGKDWSSDRATLLADLKAELPPDSWELVRVNPLDAIAASQLFPTAEILADQEVLGGLEVTGRARSVTIDNTLNTRLDRVWPRLIPLLLQELRQDNALG